MKKLIPFLILISLIGTRNAIGQMDHNFVYSSLGNSIFSTDMLNTADGGKIITGNFDSNGLIFKIDSTESVVWAKIVSTSYCELTSILQNDDSTFVITGVDYDNSTAKNYGLILMIKDNGDLVWQQHIADTLGSGRLVNALKTNDNGFLFSGYETVLKTDSVGNIQWIKSFTGSNVGTLGNIQLHDSSFVISGTRSTFQPYKNTMILFGLSPVGNLLWEKKYDYAVPSYAANISKMILVNDGIYSLFSSSDSKCGLMKTDFTGNLLTSFYYTSFDNFYIGSEYSPGDLILRLDSTLLFLSGGYLPFSFSSGDIIRTDLLGNVLYSKYIEMVSQAIIVESDSNYRVIGNGPLPGVLDLTGIQTLPLIGLILLDSLGDPPACVYQANFTPTYNAVLQDTLNLPTQTTGSAIPHTTSYIDVVINSTFGCVGIEGSVDENALGAFEVFPNPTTGIISVQLKYGNLDSEISIFDISGRLTIKKFFSGEEIYLNEKNILKPGMYTVVLKNDKFIRSRKLIVN